MRRNTNNTALCFFLVLVTLLCLIKPFSSMILAANSSLDESTREFNGSLESLIIEEDISLRRNLETKKYISPGALKRDQPVCNGGGRGQSYSKSDGCLPPESHPYTRGCSKYYRCRSDSWFHMSIIFTIYKLEFVVILFSHCFMNCIWKLCKICHTSIFQDFRIFIEWEVSSTNYVAK